MIKIALATLLVSAQPATACHRYHFWHFKEPQRGCGVTHAAYHAGAPKTYYVEITSPPPVPLPKLDPVGPPPRAEAPLEADLRTSDEIKDFDEHYIALEQHKDEINKLMIILHAVEDARNAIGIKQP